MAPNTYKLESKSLGSKDYVINYSIKQIECKNHFKHLNYSIKQIECKNHFKHLNYSIKQIECKNHFKHLSI